MATREEGGATATATTNTTASSYGGGGAGGKFRKKPPRKQTTPYDRPPTSLRPNNNGGGWLTRNVVDPASRLISYGAQRFFGSVFQKRLTPSPPPPPPPPETEEVNQDMNEDLQGAISDNQYEAQEPMGGECSRGTKSSSSKGITELEQLLRQKVFTRSEVDHLTELLRSRAEEPHGIEQTNNEVPTPEFGRHRQFANGSSNESINEGIQSHLVMSTPAFNPKDEIASPAELAKAYMGSRPSKVSPSMLGTHSLVGREDLGMLNNSALTSVSPIGSLTTKTSFRLGTPENGFRTPRSRGRSAIYNMARTPYSRVGSTSILKGSGFNQNGYNGPSMSPLSLPPPELDGKQESNSTMLKRRISAIDDEAGFVGPTRRTRQKSNLLTPRFPRTSQGVVSGFAKQKNMLIGESSHVSKTVSENEHESIPSTSRARVPSQSSEVAAKILQHLEKLSPKEKSSESKVIALQERSPFLSTPSMLSGRALRSMDGVNSSKLILDVQDDHRWGNKPDAALIEGRDQISEKLRKAEENGPKESVVHSDTWNPLKNNDSAVSLEASGPSTRFTESFVRDGASQKKRAFRTSTQEDNHVQSNGVVLGPFSGLRGLTGGSRDISFGSSEEATTAVPSSVLPLSTAAFEKPQQANNPPPLFSFSSKVTDNFPSLLSESSIDATSNPESSSSLISISAPTGPQYTIPDSVNSSHLNPSKDAEKIGKSDGCSSAATNGLLFSRHPALSFTAASNDISHISTGSALLFVSSTSTANSVLTGTGTSTLANSTGSTFCFAAAPATLPTSVVPSTAVSAPSTTSISEPAALQTKSWVDHISNSSNPGVAACAATSSGSSKFGFASSIGHSTANKQGSFSMNANFSVGSAPSVSVAQQGASIESAPLVSVPSSNMGSTTSSGSTPSNTQVSNPQSSFVFSTLAPSSDTNANVPVSGSTSGLSSKASPGIISSLSSSSNAVGSSGAAANPPPLFNFGGSSSTSSVANLSASSSPSYSSAGTSSSIASPGIFSFGIGSSSSSANTAGLSSGLASPPTFNFGGTSISASVTNTSSSFSSGTSGIFNFGGSSAPSGVSSGLASPPAFNFGGSSAPSGLSSGLASPPAFNFGGTVANTSSSFSSGTSAIFNFGGSSSVPSSAINSITSTSAPSNAFGSSLQSLQSSGFGSTLASPSPSSGFLFGATASTNAVPSIFTSSTGASSSSMFSFTASSTSALSTPSPSPTQPLFGNLSSSFAASPGNNDQMSAEDSMAEDSVQLSAPIFGQAPVSPSPSGYIFGQTVPSQVSSPFQFGGSQNHVASLNSSPFQASGSGSFSLGSGGGGDKSNRKIVKISKSRNRKK